MYYKLIEETDFDANDALYTTTSIIACVMADSARTAKIWFELLKECRIINFSSAVKIEPGTQEEYLNFMEQLEEWVNY